MAPLPSPAEAAVNRSHLDQWPRLDHRYPFVLIKSKSQIKESTAESDLRCCGLMSQDHGLDP
jgi:hypothetical protein